MGRPIGICRSQSNKIQTISKIFPESCLGFLWTNKKDTSWRLIGNPSIMHWSDSVPADNRLSPLPSKTSLPEITAGVVGLEKSSLPPIKSAHNMNEDTDVVKTKLSGECY